MLTKISRLPVTLSDSYFWLRRRSHNRAKRAYRDLYSHFIRRRDLLEIYTRLESEKLKVLLILCPMRTGSTLLAHVLSSNPDIAGLGETHRHYKTIHDFALLDLQVCAELQRTPSDHRFVLDKLVHNYIHDPRVLNHPGIRIIFMLRPPHEAVPSTVKLLHGGLPAVKRYYSKRLREIKKQAAQLKETQRSFFLTYSDLLSRTESTLRALNDFLALEHPLTPKYELHAASGRKYYGDTSARVMSGIIQSTSAPQKTSPPPDYRDLHTEYEKVSAFLQDCCRTP